MYGSHSYASIEYGGKRGRSLLHEILNPIYENVPDRFKWKKGMFQAKTDKLKKKLF